MDPLSDVLSVLRPQTYGAGAFDMGGAWSLAFPRHEGIKCYAMVAGKCWLSVEGVAKAVRLESGECFLLPQGLPFLLYSDPQVPPVAYDSLTRHGGIASSGGGGDCFIAGAHFTLAGAHVWILVDALPPVVHICDDAGRSALRWSLERMRDELSERRPGASLVAQQLAHMMLVQALRLHTAQGPNAGVGWLFALADRQIGSVIEAVHGQPGRRWTLPILAEQAGMSRSGFAIRFKVLVGETPMNYVTRWRMTLAADRLAHTDDSIFAVARSIGYESESAFSTAFKRVMACSPRRHAVTDRSPTVPFLRPAYAAASQGPPIASDDLRQVATDRDDPVKFAESASMR